jgi:DNA-binding PadR family transcriptional regulator
MSLDLIETQTSAPVRPARLGRLEEIVLLAAMAIGLDATATAIGEKIKNSYGSRKPTTILTTIDRLVEKNCMTYGWEEQPSPRKGGRRCRLHNVTPLGVHSIGRSMTATSTLAEQAGIIDRVALNDVA